MTCNPPRQEVYKWVHRHSNAESRQRQTSCTNCSPLPSFPHTWLSPAAACCTSSIIEERTDLGMPPLQAPANIGWATQGAHRPILEGPAAMACITPPPPRRIAYRPGLHDQGGYHLRTLCCSLHNLARWDLGRRVLMSLISLRVLVRDAHFILMQRVRVHVCVCVFPWSVLHSTSHRVSRQGPVGVQVRLRYASNPL